MTGGALDRASRPRHGIALACKSKNGEVLAVKITSKGQVTIPQEFRERLGFLPYTEVEFVAVDDGLKLVKSAKAGRRGGRLVARMAGRGDGELSTDEIMRLTRGEP